MLRNEGLLDAVPLCFIFAKGRVLRVLVTCGKTFIGVTLSKNKVPDPGEWTWNNGLVIRVSEVLEL